MARCASSTRAGQGELRRANEKFNKIQLLTGKNCYLLALRRVEGKSWF